jgi:K(+)-stimulated pyrophosphate-energized sodium pump
MSEIPLELWKYLWMAPFTAIIALFLAYLEYKKVKELDRGSPKMVEVSDYIMEGSKAFIKRQYFTISIIGLILAVLIYIFLDVPNNDFRPFSTIAFIIGATASLLAGAIAMLMAAITNSRTTHAAQDSRSKALETAYKGGLVMGLIIVAFSILGISILFGIYSFFTVDLDPSSVIAFGFGASLAALFAQLGGGIFTKSADVGADLVGKLEEGIPEDDARNPGVIADNVGDAVGDCAGRGADLFESISGETIGAMIVGLIFYIALYEEHPGTAIMFVIFPLIARGWSLIMTYVSMPLVKLPENDTIESNAMKPLNKAFYLTSFLSFLVFAALILIFFDGIWQLIVAAAIGILLAIFTLIATDRYTGDNKPVQDIVRASETGAATNIITGLSVGMRSTWIPLVSIVFALMASFILGYSYGNTDHRFVTMVAAALETDNVIIHGTVVRIAPQLLWGIFATTIATMAMLSVTPIILAMDGYGPIADQSGGIAEMGDAGDDIREIIDSLDYVGNTTKALAKGYGMTSAGLAALLLFQAYLQDYQIFANLDAFPVINLTNAFILSGLFLGALLPFIFTSMSLGAVGKAANEMIKEIRRQFKENGEKIMSREIKPDYAACVDVSTRAALKEMITPSLLVLLMPIAVGIFFGPSSLAAFLIGATISGILLGLTLNNAGGAWDNAKKTIEAGAYGGKGSLAHEAAIIGDTVGDPAKDTSGPSIHVLIKLVNVVAITLLPIFILFPTGLIGMLFGL